jgi:hypothetical protein
MSACGKYATSSSAAKGTKAMTTLSTEFSSSSNKENPVLLNKE